MALLSPIHSLAKMLLFSQRKYKEWAYNYKSYSKSGKGSGFSGVTSGPDSTQLCQPDATKSSTWDSHGLTLKYEDSCFQYFYTDLCGTLLGIRHVCAFGWGQQGRSLAPGSKSLKCQMCSYCLHGRNVLVPSPAETHDISSVLEMTEDRSLWDSRASAGIFTPFAMLT